MSMPKPKPTTTKEPHMATATAPADAPKMSLKERLASKTKAKAEPKKKAASSHQTVLIDDPVIADAIDKFLAASHAKKVAEGQEKTNKAILLPFVKSKRLHDMAVAGGSKIESIEYQTPSGSHFLLQCKDTISGVRGFRAPKDKDGNPLPIDQHLKSSGLPDALVSRLKNENEFKEELVLSISLSKMEKERPQLAEKLMSLIMAANEGGVTDKEGNKITFSDDDMDVMIDKNNDVTVEKGFLSRALGHCKAVSKNDDDCGNLLEKLLTAIPPQWAIGSQFSADPEGQLAKMFAAAPQQEGAPKGPVDHKTDDGKYTIHEDGKLLTVIRNSDSKEMGTKTCTDDDHVRNSVRKWKTEPANLASWIADNA